MVVEVDKAVNAFISLSESFRLVPVDALCFEDGEEVFSHGIVIAVPAP